MCGNELLLGACCFEQADGREQKASHHLQQDTEQHSYGMGLHPSTRELQHARCKQIPYIDLYALD
jgi:hypothetical protein